MADVTTPTNAQRIIDELRKRQQAGQPNGPSLADRQKQGTPRTPVPDELQPSPTPGSKKYPEKVAADAQKLSDYQKQQDANLKLIAQRQLTFDNQQREKNRNRGRASTFGTSGYGDTSTPNTGRASLYGY